MLADFGYGALITTFIVSIYGIFAAIYGARKNLHAWVESARLSMLLTFPFLTISALCIIFLLVNGNYEVEYVSSVTSSSMPVYLRITALWGGQAGSLVFWSWLMALFATAVTLRKWNRDREFLPWVIVVSLVTLSFFLILIIFFENPFQKLWLLPDNEVVTGLLQPSGSVPFIPRDGGWSNYYYGSYTAVTTPGYTLQQQVVVLETNLYATKEEKLVWSGVSETFVEDSAEQLVRTLVGMIVKDLVAKGLN